MGVIKTNLFSPEKSLDPEPNSLFCKQKFFENILSPNSINELGLHWVFQNFMRLKLLKIITVRLLIALNLPLTFYIRFKFYFI
jgi:hypothetical protein